ncbi:MAG: GTP pyrophosphokinase [Lachnospiraceae bacterium]|nr:GTP pyrophosphokinase [Lachnospiraceae bacterium]
MIYTDLTKTAMRIAYDAHYGQVDRGKTPYIFHPMHVAESMKDEDSTVVAILHDILEDTPVSAEFLLRKGIPQRLVEAVQVLTRREDEPYAEYLNRVVASQNVLALRVKYADVLHNLDETRTKTGTLPKYLEDRYHHAKDLLRTALDAMEEQ